MKRIDAVHPHEPHWYVCILGVHPGAQGKGLGKRLMAAPLAWADRDGVPCYLETTNERNLGYYERLGFALRDTIDDPGGAPTIWTMRRAQAP